MNEGCATFVHYEVMTRLHEKGLITDGSYLEFLQSHTSVALQPNFNDPRFNGGFNPYALGYEMMHDIKRICTNPTDEDREWFREFAGNRDPYGTLRDAWANYRDESFVLQFLSPALMRKFRLFKVHDDSNIPDMRVTAIHNEHGFRDIRSTLAECYDFSANTPNIQVVAADVFGTRKLTLQDEVRGRVLLEEKSAGFVLQHLANLWGYDVELQAVETKPDSSVIVLKTYTAKPTSPNPMEKSGHVGALIYHI